MVGGSRSLKLTWHTAACAYHGFAPSWASSGKVAVTIRDAAGGNELPPRHTIRI
jgi:hypothetical protein